MIVKEFNTEQGEVTMKNFLVFASMIFYIASMIGGCSKIKQPGDASSNQITSPISIVTTAFPAYDFAKAVVGNKANLTMLVNPGSEIHTFKPSSADLAAIQKANMFIYLGSDDEEWVLPMLGSIDPNEMKIIRLLDYAKPVQDEVENRTWTFPANVVKIIDDIAKKLCELDPAGSKEYTYNASTYITQIQKTEKRIHKVISESANQMMVIGDYFPLRYFVDEFGVHYRKADCDKQPNAVKSIETSEPPVTLLDTIQHNDIRYVFYVELANQKIFHTIQGQSEAELIKLYSCHNYTREDFVKGITYLSLLKENADLLEKKIKKM